MKKTSSVLIVLFMLFAVASCQQADAQKAQTKTSKQSNVSYVGSAKSDKYHRLSCEWADRINDENRIEFNSVADAKEQGYKPCKVCEPPEED